MKLILCRYKPNRYNLESEMVKSKTKNYELVCELEQFKTILSLHNI